MKLLRYGPVGSEKPALLDKNDQIRCLAKFLPDIDPMALSEDTLNRLRTIEINNLPLVNADVRIGACVNNIGKFLCIGLNFEDHAKETGAEIPPEPVVFSKFTSAVCGPNDNIIKPRGSTKLDWEVELALVIGKKVSYADEVEAREAIAGYFVCNDVSERQFQLERSGQWDLGKGCDSFGPIGPYLVTTDEIEDVNNLHMWLDVNGKRYQNGNTKTMIFKTAEIVSFLSQYMTLNPGDVVTTGTPPGVGLGQKPPVYLDTGDVIELGIEGLGKQKQLVVATPD